MPRFDDGTALDSAQVKAFDKDTFEIAVDDDEADVAYFPGNTRELASFALLFELPDAPVTVNEISFCLTRSGADSEVLVNDLPDAGPAFTFRAYDESGALVAEGDFVTSDHLSVIDVTDLVGMESFGTIAFDFTASGGGFATARYSAFGRFSVELKGACLDG